MGCSPTCHLRYRRGADLSLVDVGFSLTVANGLVPLHDANRRRHREESVKHTFSPPQLNSNAALTVGRVPAAIDVAVISAGKR